MSVLEKIKPLLKAPSFSATQARELGVSHSALEWYVKKGVILKIGRGLYANASQELPSVEWKHEELVRLITSIPESVVCLTSALDLFGLTEEFLRTHTLAIPNALYAKKIPMVKFIRLRDMDTGRTTIKLGEFEIPIFDRERTLIDSFRMLSKETAIKALKAAWKSHQPLDLKKMNLYAQTLRFDITPYLLTVTT